MSVQLDFRTLAGSASFIMIKLTLCQAFQQILLAGGKYYDKIGAEGLVMFACE